MVADARFDNPLLKVNGVSQAAIDGLFISSRDWEVARRQRVSIYEKATGELVGGFILTKQDESYHGPYNEAVMNDSVLVRMFGFF